MYLKSHFLLINVIGWSILECLRSASRQLVNKTLFYFMEREMTVTRGAPHGLEWATLPKIIGPFLQVFKQFSGSFGFRRLQTPTKWCLKFSSYLYLAN